MSASIAFGWSLSDGLRMPGKFNLRAATRAMSAVLETADEFQSGPGLVDGAHLDVDQTFGESNSPDHILGQVRRDAGSFLRPRYPERSVRYESIPEGCETLPELRHRFHE